MEYAQVVKATALFFVLLINGRVSAAAAVDREFDQESYRSLNVLMQVEQSIQPPMPAEIVCLIGDYVFNDTFVQKDVIDSLRLGSYVKALTYEKLIFLDDGGKSYALYDLKQKKMVEYGDISMLDGYYLKFFDVVSERKIVAGENAGKCPIDTDEPLISVIDLKRRVTKTMKVAPAEAMQGLAYVGEENLIVAVGGRLYIVNINTGKRVLFLDSAGLPIIPKLTARREVLVKGIPQAAQGVGKLGDFAVACEGAIQFWDIKRRKCVNTIDVDNKADNIDFTILRDDATAILATREGIYSCNVHTKKVKKISEDAFCRVNAISARSFFSNKCYGVFTVWEKEELGVTLEEYKKYKQLKKTMQQAPQWPAGKSFSAWFGEFNEFSLGRMDVAKENTPLKVALALRQWSHLRPGHASEDVALPEFCGS